MTQGKSRIVGEFVVIVVGVLVALAVDDVRDYRIDRGVEAHLLERLEDDLAADAGDLALAQLVLRRRGWIFAEIDRYVRTGEPTRPIPDSIARLADVAELVRAAGRADDVREDDGWYDVVGDPLWSLYFTPEFDQADDAFQEMIVGGTLRTLRDADLRSSILAYYRTSRDMGANVMAMDAYNSEWIDLLLDRGIASGDPITLDDIARVVREHPRMATHVRHGMSRVDAQAGFLEQIRVTMTDLRTRLSGASGSP